MVVGSNLHQCFIFAMAAFQKGLENLTQEVTQLKQHFELIKPKFIDYDTELNANATWKVEIEKRIVEQAGTNTALISQHAETVAALQALYDTQTRTVNDLQDLYDKCHLRIKDINEKLLHLPPGSHGERKEKWQLTRPKDMTPGIFAGKDEEWPRWKESVEDYVEAVYPGLKELLRVTSKEKEEVLEKTVRDEGYVEAEWSHRTALFTLLKTKTEPHSEARNLIMCVPRENGYEAWRTLTTRFEPQVGIRRMKEISELTQLQNKRCKTRQKRHS